MRRHLLLATSLTATLLLGGSAAVAGVSPAPYANGLEVDQSTLSSDEAFTGVERVASGTDGIPASEGSWMARVGETPYAPPYVLTRLGGSTASFPEGGWTVDADLWLSPSMSPLGADRQFDWASAANSSTTTNGVPDPGRNVTLHIATDGNAGFVATISDSVPHDTASPFTPVAFTAPADGGWFTMRHTFRDADGVLAIDVALLGPDGSTVGTWTYSNADDEISTMGGPRYAWVARSTFPALHLDDVTRVTNTPEPEPHDNRDGEKKAKSNNRDGDKHDTQDNRDGDKHTSRKG